MEGVQDRPELESKSQRAPNSTSKVLMKEMEGNTNTGSPVPQESTLNS